MSTLTHQIRVDYAFKFEQMVYGLVHWEGDENITIVNTIIMSLLYVDDMLTVRHNAKKIVVFMEDKTIEDWKQKKLVSSSQSTTFMELALVDPPSTHPVGRQQPFDEAVWEMEKMW